MLTARQVIFVALEMLDSGQYELGHLATCVQDVIRRGRISREAALQLAVEAERGREVGRALRPHRSAAVRADRRGVPRRASASSAARTLAGAGDVEPLDYVRLVDEEHEQRRTRRKRGMH